MLFDFFARPRRARGGVGVGCLRRWSPGSAGDRPGNLPAMGERIAVSDVFRAVIGRGWRRSGAMMSASLARVFGPDPGVPRRRTRPGAKDGNTPATPPTHTRTTGGRGGTAPLTYKTRSSAIMTTDQHVERFFEVLINGDRPGARRLVREAEQAGASSDQLIADLYWPTYELVERLFRNDQLSQLSYRLATRLLRVMVDQTALGLERGHARRRSVFAVCGPNDADELGAQMAVDLLEAGGFDVTYAGGSIPADEIMGYVHEEKPDVLLLFASAPSDLPEIRGMIDQIHEINACPDLQIVVGGGVFNRAEGLAEEIGADLWASDPIELVESMTHEPLRRAEPTQRTVGRTRQQKQRRAA
ncbi:MAG: cobalamin B12-binding domain-containing protein [Phycisphaerales bacterium]|nr:MAG: cobalamin B12-binding domain-containing protein [Phycisphaerales bacterium]